MRLLTRMSPPQVLASGMLAIILAGAFLLSMPQASASGERTPFLDALFTSTSAVCVTGLTVYNTGGHFSLFGEIVLLALIQVGGLGFMAMATLIALVFRKRISFRERLILQQSMNQSSTEGIVRLIRKVLLYSLAIELMGAMLLTVHWMGELPPGKAAYFGMFHSVSIFNNAGFELVSSLDHRPGGIMHYAEDPFFNVVAIALIFLGGLGFIVIDDLLAYRRNRRLLLHSKVVLVFSGFLFLIGAVVILIFEYTNPMTFQPLTAAGKTFSAMFHSLSARSAGLSTVDVSALRQATQFLLILLMFIGAAPGSQGGGIKVTTFAILCGALYAMFRGKDDIVLFRNRIAPDRIHKAITFTFLTFFLVVAATTILSVTEPFPFLGILFEVTSAMATTGLSMGLTPQLTDFGKTAITLLMFIGRLGPVTLAFILVAGQRKELYRHPEGRIIIG